MGAERRGVKATRCARCGGINFGPAGLCSRCRELPCIERDLVGEEKERVLAEFAQWLKGTSSAWERAQGGLMMAVPHNPRTGCWP